MSKNHQQKIMRERQNERAFLFDPDFRQCLAEVDREKWEMAISFAGGKVSDAAGKCGLANIPKGAKVLWGKSAQGALDTYRRWQKKKKHKK